MKLSVVIPCLNESETVGECVKTARLAIDSLGLVGEVIVADNASSDRSAEIAGAEGARVVRIEAKGYGSALDGGIRSSRGEFIIMGDADGSYNFGELARFLERWQAGFELVVGCRMPSGGGTIEPGAMPFLHRWLGNPVFSFMSRWWFHAPIHDVNCGLRGFTRDLYERIRPQAHGMSFAAEMIIKAAQQGAAITEVPLAFRRDGRKENAPHLRTFRDGWKILRMFINLRGEKGGGRQESAHSGRARKLK